MVWLAVEAVLTTVLLPRLARALQEQAPGVSLSVQAFSDRDHAVDLLDAGTIDAAVGVSPSHQESRIRTQPSLRDEFVTLIRRNHPLARHGMELATYLTLSHVLVSPEGDRHGIVDQALAQQGQQRRLGLTLPEMFAAPSVVAQTDMTATLMRRVAISSPARRQLLLFPPPLALPPIVFNLIWHRRHDAHPAPQWSRQRIVEIVSVLWAF